MPHSFGKRARTRQKFSKSFRKHGAPPVSRYLQTIKRGDFVDIVVDSAIQKGMPFQFYHGRTGRVFDLTPRAVGVEIAKVVGNREILKRLHVRIEHVRKSRCQDDFKRRVLDNENRRKIHKETGEVFVMKRQPVGPRKGESVFPERVVDLEIEPFKEIY